MTGPTLFWLMAGGAGITMLSATAAWVITDIAWHELEESCKIKKQPQLFGRIYERREPMRLGAEFLSNISSVLYVAAGAGWWLGSRSLDRLTGMEFLLATGLLALGLVLVASWIPWAIARVGAVPFLFGTWRWWWGVAVFAKPLMAGGHFLSAVFARASGQPQGDEDQEEAFEDEILSMVSEGEQDGYIESDTRDMIEGIMELDDTDVRSIMTPRSQVDIMAIETTWDDILAHVIDSGRTRIPVYRNKMDTIVGLLYAKDLLSESQRGESKRRPLRKLLREPLFVPEQTRLDEMLSQFLRCRTHMAIVQDEYGGLAGVVTIEDVLEEIVGEIVDETDKEQHADITVLSEGQVDVAGAVHIDDVNESLGLELPQEAHFDTLSGLIMFRLNKIPRRGHELVVGNVHLTIRETNRRQILVVRITVLDKDASEGSKHLGTNF